MGGSGFVGQLYERGKWGRVPRNERAQGEAGGRVMVVLDGCVEMREGKKEKSGAKKRAEGKGSGGRNWETGELGGKVMAGFGESDLAEYGWAPGGEEIFKH